MLTIFHIFKHQGNRHYVWNFKLFSYFYPYVKNILRHFTLCSFMLTIAVLHFKLLILVYRLLANNTADVEDKKHFLLDGLSQIQLAVSQQEDVVLNVQTLLPSQSEVYR